MLLFDTNDVHYYFLPSLLILPVVLSKYLRLLKYFRLFNEVKGKYTHAITQSVVECNSFFVLFGKIEIISLQDISI